MNDNQQTTTRAERRRESYLLIITTTLRGMSLVRAYSRLHVKNRQLIKLE